MRIFKSIAVRAVALLLFFAMISAVILYQAGVYDLSFIDRPTPPVTDDPFEGTEDGTDSPDTTDPIGTTEDPNLTETLPPVDDDAVQQMLAAIPTLSALRAEGYQISADRFWRKSLLAKYENTFDVTDFSLRDETVSKTILVRYENGLFGTTSINVTSAVPHIRFYFGLILVDNGRTCTIYNQEGKELVKNFTGTFPMARSKGGLPVVRIGTGYYVIDPNKGLGEIISEEQVDFKALSFDHPLDYASKSSVGLYPFCTYVDIFTYVGEKPKPTEPTTEAEDTEPPETDPEETTGEETTGEKTTSQTEDVGEETTTTDTTAATEGSPEETTTAGTTATPDEEAEPQVIAEEDSDPEQGEGQEEGEDSSSSEQTTVTETESESDSEIETETEEETTQDPMIPVNGTVEIDGSYYKVTQELRWGYRDADGNVVIEPQYHSAYDFTEDGLAAVTDGDGNLFFINTSGNEVVTLRNQIFVNPPEFNYSRYRQYYVDSFQRDLSSIGMYYYDDGYVMVRYCLRGERYVNRLYKSVNRLIDTSGREYLLPNGYTLEGYSEGVMLLSKNGRYGYMDTTGGWVSPAVYTKASPFLQGLAVAVDENGKYGMIDTEGNLVLPFYFDYISDASGGMVAAYSQTDGWQIYCVVEK